MRFGVFGALGLKVPGFVGLQGSTIQEVRVLGFRAHGRRFGLFHYMAGSGLQWVQCECLLFRFPGLVWFRQLCSSLAINLGAG